MIKELKFDGFCNEFKNVGSESAFSNEGFKKLYTYLEEVYGGTYLLDVQDLLQEFQEDDLKEVLEKYHMSSFDELLQHTVAFKLNNYRVLFGVF